MRYHLVAAPFAVAALVLALASVAQAGPLSVVNVNAQAYQFIFSPTGEVVVEETVDIFDVPGAYHTGHWARLYSRTTKGQAGAPAAGLYRYSYQLNLVDVYSTLSFNNPVCIKSMTIKFGSIVSTLDYNGDGDSGDHVFVITNGPGSVGLASAVQTGSNVTFTFAGDGVCSANGTSGPIPPGESSFFFGLVSTRAPKFVTAFLPDHWGMTTGNCSTPHCGLTQQARAPKSFVVSNGDRWDGRLQNVPELEPAWTLELSFDSVRGRGFGGTLSIRDPRSDAAPIVIPVVGTFSADGHLQIIGRGRGTRFMANATEEEGATVFTGRYRMTLSDGRSSEGILSLAEDARLLPTTIVER